MLENKGYFESGDADQQFCLGGGSAVHSRAVVSMSFCRLQRKERTTLLPLSSGTWLGLWVSADGDATQVMF